MKEIIIEENRFKEARIRRNRHGKQSVKDVALETGISRSLIDDLETTINGGDKKKRNVSYLTVKKLAKHYGVTMDYLANLSNVSSPNPKIREVCEFTGLNQEAIEELIKPHPIDSVHQDQAGVAVEGYNESDESNIKAGLSLLLSNPNFYAICLMLNKLVNSIPNEKSMPYPFTRTREDGSYMVEAGPEGLRQLERNAATEIQMDILNRFPDEHGKIGFLYGSYFADFQLRTIVDCFGKVVESISGIREYIDRAWTVSPGRR